MENNEKKDCKIAKRERCYEFAVEERSEFPDDRSWSNAERCLIYDVLRIIMKYLNIRDLKNAGYVSRVWQKAALDEEKARLWPDVFMIHLDEDPSKKDDTLHRKCINNLWIKPVMGLLFHNLNKTERIRWNCTSNHNDCICKHLPHDCDTIIVNTYGVVCDETEIEDTDDTRISCFFLPKVPNVEITSYSFSYSSENRERYKNKKDLQAFMNSPDAKCIILLALPTSLSFIKNTLKSITRRYGLRRIPMCGGICPGLYLCKEFSRKKSCSAPLSWIAIRISGADVDSWSVIIKHETTKKMIEEKLKIFRANIKLRKYSVGLKFSCLLRGTRIFNHKDVESKLFRKVFPDVPLTGCFSGGEFGHVAIDKGFDFHHGYHEKSTVFLILSYG
ncbi:uncharacterized protein LOC105702862 [Orussus abietinus]|uniref:uncharacterized protein LOC105702862 n=1 Tax=Orussus abietinus TaxID=222816 RepID=UPI0006252804|nr:uncharacterized protein LOC105702862 [Orussus abietinus]